MIQANATYYLTGFVLEVFFAVGSWMVYRMLLEPEERFLASLCVICFAVSYVGAAICLWEFVF